MTNEVLSNNQDEEVSGSSKNENIKEDIYDSNQHKNKNEEMLDSTDEEEIVTENVGYRTSLCKRLRHDTDLLNLKQFLQESCTDRGIINDYEKNSILSRKSRNNLVTLIINHFLDKSR